MKRLFRMTVNFGLLLISVWAAYALLVGADRLAGFLIPERAWPGPAGLLFIPGTVDSHKTHDYTCTDRINSLGFKDREFTLQKTSKFRILAIGDSFTFGWGVNNEDTWCKRLEANLRNSGLDVEILDLGKPGAGPRRYAKIAECTVPRLKPDLVIIGMHCGGDFLDLEAIDLNAFLTDSFPNLLFAIQHLKYSGNASPPPASHTPEEEQKYYAKVAQETVSALGSTGRENLAKLDPSVKEAFLGGMLNPWFIGMALNNPERWMTTLDRKDSTDRMRRAEKAFRRIRNIAERNGARAIVLDIPDGVYVNTEAHNNRARTGFQMDPSMLATNDPNEMIAKAAARAGLKAYCHVTDAFRKHMDEKGLYFEMDDHMAPAGYALFAETVTPVIASEIAAIAGASKK